MYREQYRWFKVLSITIAISFTLIFLGENVFNEEYGILPILGYLLFPSSAIYLSIDKLSPPWIRGASLGIIVTFWPLFLFPLIRWGRVEETGYFIALIAIPLTIIGFIIGLVIGIIINMIKNKRNK